MYSTRTRVGLHAHIPNGHAREEKRASAKVRGLCRRAKRPRVLQQADFCGAVHADFRARILARKSARKSVSVLVSVSVSVQWNLSLTNHN